MKKLITLVCFLVFGLTQAQEVIPTFEKSGDLVKATYFYDNGKVKEQGFFKDKKLTGTWVSYNEKGEKSNVAHYNKGKKVGKWMLSTNEGVKEVNYENNVVASVKPIHENTNLAVK